MTAQEYIKSRLDILRTPLDLPKPANNDELAGAIFKLLTSKKFRKYSLDPAYAQHIRGAIGLSIERQEPVKIAFVFGGYKLWRLDESPQADWAELFSVIYYTNWVKAVCQIYPPGVWFDFFSDDVIVPRLNNVPAQDSEAYRQSFQTLLDFVAPRLPANLSMTFHRVVDQYENQQAFEADLAQQLQTLTNTLPGGLPVLDDEQRAAIDLNVKLTPGQADDPQWREKVQLLHDAYAQVTRRRPHYRAPDKIMAITRRLPNTIAVGTTKQSVMKFWIGADALEQTGADFDQLILSPKQLGQASFDWQDVQIAGLAGKNFRKIRVLTA